MKCVSAGQRARLGGHRLARLKVRVQPPPGSREPRAPAHGRTVGARPRTGNLWHGFPPEHEAYDTELLLPEKSKTTGERKVVNTKERYLKTMADMQEGDEIAKAWNPLTEAHPQDTPSLGGASSGHASDPLEAHHLGGASSSSGQASETDRANRANRAKLNRANRINRANLSAMGPWNPGPGGPP